MIVKLNNANEAVAKQIYTTFQRSYKIEAELIGALNFPPLSRTVTDIHNSQTLFYGFYDDTQLAGVIELAVSDKQLEINSLTVDPEHLSYIKNMALLSSKDGRPTTVLKSWRWLEEGGGGLLGKSLLEV